ncbi:MAG: hypothetical protein V4525_00675 [Pseudomonadota bacterium]
MPTISQSNHCRAYQWNRLIYAQQRHSRKKLIGGNAHLRQWFSFKGSMTRQLRAIGKLHLDLHWFQARLKIPGFRYSSRSNPFMLIRHALLHTSKVSIEAWVWIPWSSRIKERNWFSDANRPIGDLLFKYKQHRNFIFFKCRGDHRFFRYSMLKTRHNSYVEIIEAMEATLP